MSKWICTDPDANQYGRQLDYKVYEFKEDIRAVDGSKPTETYEDVINLNEYSIEQMFDHIAPYYSWEDFNKLLVTEEGRWIIAECIFEQESGQY